MKRDFLVAMALVLAGCDEHSSTHFHDASSPTLPEADAATAPVDASTPVVWELDAGPPACTLDAGQH